MSPLLSNCFSLLHSSEFDSVGASRVLCADSSSTFFKYLKSKLFRVNFNVVRVRSVYRGRREGEIHHDSKKMLWERKKRHTRIVALFCTWSLRWCWVSDQQGRLPFDRVPQVHGQALVLSLIVSDQIVQGLKKRFAPLKGGNTVYSRRQRHWEEKIDNNQRRKRKSSSSTEGETWSVFNIWL